ncbi:hypothetical protein V1525DRAFT_431730 [Lipomyces kononenkoae]|uniref:Uncharacterized protein n=1 Tax=Lipomyces kononenkoae TaxID=34357 RepID=A0ACC3T525_LIPKO
MRLLPQQARFKKVAGTLARYGSRHFFYCTILRIPNRQHQNLLPTGTMAQQQSAAKRDHEDEAKIVDDSSSSLTCVPSPSSSTASASTVVSVDKTTILSSIAETLERMESKPLMDQRYKPSAEKLDTFNNLALIAKIEKALGRRLTSQDFVPNNNGSSTGVRDG